MALINLIRGAPQKYAEMSIPAISSIFQVGSGQNTDSRHGDTMMLAIHEWDKVLLIH